jgi:hypothetical protein
MDDFLNLIIQYGPHIGLAVIVAGIVQSLKVAFKKFFVMNTVGVRILPFVPLILGFIGGFFLPETTVASKMLVGGALGTMSTTIYNVITRTFARTENLQQRIDAKSGAPIVPPVADPGGPGDEVK